MAHPPSKMRVFDHDNGTLLNLSKDVGFEEVVTLADGDEAQEEAKNFLFEDSDWEIAFVHMDDTPWEQLCKSAPKGRIIMRFSTVGFAPHPPEGKSGLCFRCLKEIETLNRDNIKTLKNELGGAIELLRHRYVPEALIDFVSFDEPHYLRALEIILRGILATWASDPQHERNEKAREIFGDLTIPILPKRSFDVRRSLWRCLGLEVTKEGKVKNSDAKKYREAIACELGVKDFDKHVAFKGIVQAILEGPADVPPDMDAVLHGFYAVKEFINKR